jgi:CheY-like chemotaxis protein
MGIELLDMSTNINAEERESLLMMQSASEFMSDTLDNVLCLQKIEEGKFELEMVHFSIEKVISRVFLTFRGAIVKKNLFLTHDILPLVPSQLVGDVHRIEHVISNLLNNAIKFSSHGKAINVVVSCDAFCKKDIRHMIANVTVSIQDEGAGISEEDQAKLFSSFVQIRPGTIQKGQGSGLGLSFCKQMVEFHGGVIGVKSLEGHGSKFEFTIPFPVPLCSESGKVDCIEPASSVPRGSLVVTRRETKDSYGKKGQPYDIEAHIKETERANLCSISVLVVDDADSNRKILMILLKKAGLETDSREDGQQAVDLISADMNAYQLVLMDNFMPVMNGLDAVRNLRARGYPYIIVGITGNSMADDLAEYLASGADMIVSKPLKKRTLDMLIQHIAKCGTLSRPEMRLIQGTNTIQWSSRI